MQDFINSEQGRELLRTSIDSIQLKFKEQVQLFPGGRCSQNSGSLGDGGSGNDQLGRDMREPSEMLEMFYILR